MDHVNHSRFGYPTDEAEKLIGGIGKPKLNDLIKLHEVHTYRVGRKLFIPAFEIDRLIGELLRQEKYRRFEVKNRERI